MRNQAQLQMAMDEWLETRGLSVQESVMIRTLRTAAKKGDFILAAETALRFMPNVVKTAIEKARNQGVLQEWPRIA